MTLTVGSLFSGIGGIDLGCERAGMVVRWQSEIDPYCTQILAKHWPTVPNLGDIEQIDWHNVEPVDVIAGGYPCQPFSLAGQRKGTDDDRHLWPFFFDAIRILRPRYALLENVAGHLTLGFGEVLADLAAIGYDVEWDCIPAAAVGAPHRRDRLWAIATNINRIRCNRRSRKRQEPTRWPEPSLSYWWADQPIVCRMVYGIPRRVDRVRALGNAVVPQVAEHVARIIIDKERAA